MNADTCFELNAACGGDYRQIGGVEAVPIVRDGIVVGGAIFHGYQPGQDITMTVTHTGSRPMTRGMILEVFRYPFVQLGLPRVSAEIEEGNEASVKLARGVGFRLEGVKRGSPRILCFGLLRGEFKFEGLL